MKERPIFFSASMIRALLSDAKTMTRRIVKPQPEHHWECLPGYSVTPNGPHDYEDGRAGFQFIHSIPQNRVGDWDPWVVGPYGVGQVLWVRETWRPDASHDPEDTLYRADKSDEWERIVGHAVRWRSPISMPRNRSRITLRVTSRRVERVQAITEADAIAEGIRAWTKDGALYKYAPADAEGDGPCWPWVDCPRTAVAAFERLWREINGDATWDSSAWVWAVGFERVKT